LVQQLVSQKYYSAVEPVPRSIDEYLGREFSIFGSDSMGHCEKKVRMSICLILNGYNKYSKIALLKSMQFEIPVRGSRVERLR
jgi:hypothetical protein